MFQKIPCEQKKLVVLLLLTYAKCSFGNEGCQIIQCDGDLFRHMHRHAIEMTHGSKHLSFSAKQWNAVIALNTLPLGMNRDAAVQRGLAYAETLAGLVYVNAIAIP